MFLSLQHLAALLITQQVIGQIKEAMVPFIFMRRRKKQVDEMLKKTSTVEKVEYFNKEVDSELQKQVNLETTMDEYEVCV
jgi:hypothetical protein